MPSLMFYIYLFANIPLSKSSTHWLVTEDGRIQGQYDSIFNLRRPYDLMALLKQESRAVMLESLKEELLARKEEIDRNEDKDTGLEQRFYKTDKDCITAGKPLPEFDLYISTVLPLENKGIRPEEHIDFKAPPTTAAAAKAPFCTEFMELQYSLHAFEHLEGIKERHNLTGSPELGLKNAITHRDNVDDYGHLIYEALKKNSTSWVLYNMAAFYWRIKGDPLEVVECLRRALHYSPRLHKDVALISLANVLHRSRFSHEAAVVVHAALDVSKELNVNHFTLGNIYAVLAEYNKSVICFENTLKIQPDFEAAAKRKHAVMCHSKLEEALEMQHQSLQRTLAELRDYQRKHEYWQAQNEKLVTEQASVDFRYEQRVGYDQHKERESAVNIGEFCQVVEQNGRNELECSWGRKIPIINDLDFGWTDPNQDDMYDDVRGEGPDYRQPVRSPVYSSRRQPSPEEEEAAVYKDKDWPSKEECDTYVQKFPAYNEYPTTYLPAENKGFQVKALLNEAQGLKSGAQHPLPWYPPTCVPLANIPEGRESFDHVTAVRERDKVPDKIPDRSMKSVLLDLVDNQEMTEEEVGQRILTALKKKVGPNWVLYNLAGLYWRIVGNNKQGIECLRRAIYYSPVKYRDVPLVNLASVLYKWGRIDDTVTVMREAVNINDLEPETHFFLGNMLAAKGNLTGSIWHYLEALNQSPGHTQAFQMMRNLRCYEKFHRSSPVPRDLTPGVVRAAGGAGCVTTAPSPGCAPSPGSNAPVNSGVNAPKPTTTGVKCQNTNGKESCVVETEGAGGQKEICTITPIKVGACVESTQEGATGSSVGDNTMHIGPAEGDVTSAGGSPSNQHNNQPSNQPPTAAAGCNHDNKTPAGCHHNNPSAANSARPPMDPGLNHRLEEVSEYLKDKGVCEGKDCHKLLLQADKKPHTRLEIVDGVLHQRLMFVDSGSELHVSENECVVYNTGGMSEGCSREEYKSFFREEFEKYLSQSCGPNSGIHDNDNNIQCNIATAALSNAPGVNLATVTGDKADKTVKHMKLQIDNTVEIVFEEPEGIESISDQDIITNKPDPLRHIYVSRSVTWPTWDICKATYRHVDFTEFLSSWVSVSTKGVNLADHVDFTSDVTIHDIREPRCDVTHGLEGALLEQIEGVASPKDLKYKPEGALRDTLQTLGGRFQTVGVVGTRLARALKKTPDSWVAANLAALYWRVQGDAVNAVRCVKVAYSQAPKHARDISLLSLTNILHQSGHTQSAIITNDMALEASPKIVGLHFSMANLYAARGKVGMAARFYEATLGLQPGFEPASRRLHQLRCNKILSNPHTYNNNNNNK